MKKLNILRLFSTVAIASLGICGALSLKPHVKTNRVDAVDNTPVTKIVLKDSINWYFRTFWCEDFSYASGYSVAEFRDFLKGHYVNNVTGTWDPQSTTSGYHEYNQNFNICAGGSSGTYTFYFPTWVTNFKITVQNSGNERYMGYISAIRKWHDNDWDLNGSGLGKEITIDVKNNGGSPLGTGSVGSAATNSSWNTTVSLITKDDLGNTISTTSGPTSKYDILDTSIPWGYTSYAFYTNEGMTTSHNSKLPLTKTTIYKKVTVNKVAYVAGTFNSWNASDSNYLMLPKGEQQFYIRVTLAANAEFKFVVWSEWHGWSQVDKSSTVVTNGSIVQGTDPDSKGYRIKVAVAGTYEVYFKNNYDANKIWIQQDAATEAAAYATEFLATITCTENSVTFERNVWNHVSGTASMEYKFSQLTEGARGLLTIAQANKSGTAVQQCAARYDRILSKYGYGSGANQYHDFMGRTPAPIAGTVAINAILTSNINVTVIVLISVVSVGAIGGYFFVRRRKEN